MSVPWGLGSELTSQVRLFTDDKAVFPTVEGIEDGKMLQNVLDRLSGWEDRWEFNPSKCQVVQVTTARRAINTAYTLHGQALEVVTSARYLEVDISSGLSWNSHIYGTARKRNIKTKIPEVRETAYITLVRP